MELLVKVKLVQDNSGHWYTIPNEKIQRFHDLMHIIDNSEEELSDLYYNSCDEMDSEFGRYRTNGDPNNIQLYANLKEKES